MLSLGELVYVSDEEPGIRRLKRGKGFQYLNAKGAALSFEDKERIAKIVIPPAWKDVWICQNPRGHIQATGRDVRGRKQYRYHADWTLMRGNSKFANLAGFASGLSDLRRRVDKDMRRRAFSRDKVIATVIWLMDRLLLRVGNIDYARNNKSFGVTTLRNRHLREESGELRLIFKGKSGKDWNLKISDRRISKIIRSLQELPGQQLFQYFDEAGQRHAISSQDINAYLRNATHAEFTSKHFRTWAATSSAFKGLIALERPATTAARKKMLNCEIDKIAQQLCNTRAVCRSSYIHPLVLKQWEDDLLHDEAELASKQRLVAPLLDEGERITLKWLLHVGTSQ
ncbi:DNA topoisomerase IB [Brucella sp. NBRC 12950]|uniref:DNA topoisomerase IB n=1 Tax=Brucella sp. NBRC 12950 TaxID=2994518 RepID=UPI00249FED81|nr:DNA topoisomerase IB [Brucella sp. NBRC 12950]GLU29324.1 DNA topoisomerase [Brucella sp. NBRC 12950]